MASSRLNGGAARRRSGGSLARLGRLGGPAAPEAAPEAALARAAEAPGPRPMLTKCVF